jgi:hypothetical protein
MLAPKCRHSKNKNPIWTAKNYYYYLFCSRCETILKTKNNNEEFSPEVAHLVAQSVKPIQLRPDRTGLSLAGLLTKQHVYLLFDPGLVVRNVLAGRLVKHEAAEIGELVNELEQLADVVRYRWRVGVHFLEVLLKNFARPLETLIDGLVVGVRATFWLLAGLNKQDCVRHSEDGNDEKC